MNGKKLILITLLALFLMLSACSYSQTSGGTSTSAGDLPLFTEEEITTEAYESYGELDNLGRCTVAMACLGLETMPTEDRGSIGQIKPSGWHTVKYDNVDGKYLYNRCHLIGFQLSGENSNKRNLITGTRYFNNEGMLPYENMVADYIKETGNHVMYRVTPLFEGDNLVAKGVQIEAYSVEDEGEGICFNVFVENIQPGIEINYLDGTSRLSTAGEGNDKTEEEPKAPATEKEEPSAADTPKKAEASVDEAKSSTDGAVPGTNDTTYVLNTSTMKFHHDGCSSIKTIKAGNKEEFTGNREQLTDRGYSPCKKCNP